MEVYTIMILVCSFKNQLNLYTNLRYINPKILLLLLLCNGEVQQCAIYANWKV